MHIVFKTNLTSRECTKNPDATIGILYNSAHCKSTNTILFIQYYLSYFTKTPLTFINGIGCNAFKLIVFFRNIYVLSNRVLPSKKVT